MGATFAAAAPASLAGTWGGDRAILTLSDQGGRLEFDCGYATLTGPITLDGAGGFKAKGVYFPQEPGLVDADKPPKQSAAHFTGSVNGANLRLNFQWDGVKKSFEMVSGKQQKLVRCL